MRKRRKAAINETTPDIPFQKVRVEWVDCVSDSAWASDKEFDKMKLARPINEGWLYSKDKEPTAKAFFNAGFVHETRKRKCEYSCYT